MALNTNSERRRRSALKWESNSKSKMRVSFAPKLERVHFVETYYNDSEVAGGDNVVPASLVTTSRLTEEIRLLSTEHGRARRYLREIPKISLQAAVKHGRKERTFLNRWKYTFQNVVCITDYDSKELITCYKESVSIKAAPISDEMLKRHEYVKRIIKEEPKMCTSYFVVIVDQSGSMRTSDVNGFRTRSDAAYGCLALDFVAEQLAHEEASMVAGIDTLTLIEMNDCANGIIKEEPLDWILFNKLLNRQTLARPRSHGNYLPSIEAAKNIIMRYRMSLKDIDTEDLPAFALILLSDGKPSDKGTVERSLMSSHIKSLSLALKEKFTFVTMGIGAKDSDFAELKKLSEIATISGGKGEFNHAGCSAANIGAGFSNIASSMSSVRSGLLSKSESEIQKDETKLVLPLKRRQSFSKVVLAMDDAWKATKDVSRFKLKRERSYDDFGNFKDNWAFHWVPMIIKNKAVGFAMDKIAFAEGTERFAYRFQELDDREKLVGKNLVAKEIKGVRDESKKRQFHKQFCRGQWVAADLAKQFNKAVYKTQSLKPESRDDPNPPKITFAKCSVYRYKDKDSEQSASILVENFLKGKFTKYNSNNGFVDKGASKKSPTIVLKGGEARLTDFLQAFSHWTYVHSDQRLLLCDLQGVLNQEGRSPRFELTDPAFCTVKQKSLSTQCFGGTDVGLKGIRSFFRSHECNIVCDCLGLPGAEVNLGVKDRD